MCERHSHNVYVWCETRTRLVSRICSVCVFTRFRWTGTSGAFRTGSCCARISKSRVPKCQSANTSARLFTGGPFTVNTGAYPVQRCSSFVEHFPRSTTHEAPPVQSVRERLPCIMAKSAAPTDPPTRQSTRPVRKRLYPDCEMTRSVSNTTPPRAPSPSPTLERNSLKKVARPKRTHPDASTANETVAASWTPSADALLHNLVTSYGPKNWGAHAKVVNDTFGTDLSHTTCRERWERVHRKGGRVDKEKPPASPTRRPSKVVQSPPSVRQRRSWTSSEDKLLAALVLRLGRKWDLIATLLNTDRTAHTVQRRFYAFVRSRVVSELPGGELVDGVYHTDAEWHALTLRFQHDDLEECLRRAACTVDLEERSGPHWKVLLNPPTSARKVLCPDSYWSDAVQPLEEDPHSLYCLLMNDNSCSSIDLFAEMTNEETEYFASETPVAPPLPDVATESGSENADPLQCDERIDSFDTAITAWPGVVTRLGGGSDTLGRLPRRPSRDIASITIKPFDSFPRSCSQKMDLHNAISRINCALVHQP